MLIHEPQADSGELRELRIRIPIGLHVKLRAIRLLRGTSISDAVTEALDEYFARTLARPEAEAVARAEKAASGGDA